MYRKTILLFAVFIMTGIGGFSQNFTKTMNQQKAAIKAAYKKGRITQREYGKLMDEQQDIGVTIRKYSADGYLSSTEKDRIASKQRRAADRLRKYRTNRERY